MQATTVFEKLLSKELSSIHKSRLHAIFFAVKAIIHANTLSIAKMARAYPGPTTPKGHHKRLDRLINNPRLHQDIERVGRWILTHFIAADHRPILLVDWTEIDGGFHALSAAIPLDGRSLPVLWCIYPEGMQNSPRAHRDFLGRLHAMMPAHFEPILVTDGMFRGPWFRQVEKLGWDFVGRVSHLNVNIYLEDSQKQQKVGDLLAQAGAQVTDVGEVGLFGTTSRVKGRAVLGKRFERNPTRQPRKRRNRDRGRSFERAKERDSQPWVIFTSLGEVEAKAVDAIYALRMRIEELYRDTKNARFGWALRQVRHRSAERYENLLVLASLAMAVVMATGSAGEQLGWRRHYQSNTIMARRVLSIFVMGQAILQRGDIYRFTISMWRKGWQNLAEQAADCCELALQKSGET